MEKNTEELRRWLAATRDELLESIEELEAEYESTTQAR